MVPLGEYGVFTQVASYRLKLHDPQDFHTLCRKTMFMRSFTFRRVPLSLAIYGTIHVFKVSQHIFGLDNMMLTGQYAMTRTSIHPLINSTRNVFCLQMGL